VIPALALTAFTLAGTHGAATHISHQVVAMNPLGYALAGGAAAILLLRRIAPAATVIGCAALVGTYLAIGFTYGPVLIAPAIAAIAAAARLPTARSVRACAITIGLVALGLAIRLARDPSPGAAFAMVLGSGWLILAWAFGSMWRMRRETFLRARREEADRTVATERLRIAAEVHDVAGHGLAVIAMQAGVALHVLERRPEQARIALEEIRTASTQALLDLRATLDTMRDATEAPRRPGQSDVGDLPALVDRIRRAGLPVTLDLQVAGATLAPATQHAAYRIVQESLTNVLRHANAESAGVTVRIQGEALEIAVVDDGRNPTHGPAGGGISGMRERAARVGGTLAAGLRPGGGFEVRAVLPVRPGGSHR
jgi:signal transduction histidine kinase